MLMMRRMTLGLLLISLLSTASAAPPAKPAAAKPGTAKQSPSPPRTGSTPVASRTSVTRSSAKSHHTILLAQNGKAMLPIIISEKSSDATKAVAAELAEYLKRISGATFEVKTGDGGTGIVLGTLAQFPNLSLIKPLEIKGFDGKEAFAIRTEPERVLLIGATGLGTSHAAYRFLELLGYRHFFAAPEWEVVPSIATLRFDRDETDRPTILSRNIWYGMGVFSDPGKGPNDSRSFQDYLAWRRHNRMAGSFIANYGHAYQTIVLENQEVFDKHPEYVALVNGKRYTQANFPDFNIELVQLCISNPDVRKIAVQWAVDYFKKNPQADMVSMEPSDGTMHCQCDDCKKMGSVSERVFGLANEAAKAVAKTYPGKMVGLYAYSDHSEPPSFSLEPSVFIEITNGFNAGRYSFDQLLELWPGKARNIGIYEYYSFWMWDYDKLPGGLGANVPYHKKQIPRYAAANAVAIDAESGNNWGPHGRGYYVANRLMWNPRTNIEALLQDFYTKAFGPVAAPMRRFYERFDPGNEPLMSVHLLAAGFRDIDEASKLAKDRPDIQARLDQLKRYMRFMHLWWQMERETDKDKKKALTLAVLTHTFRSRYDYMNHWNWMESAWAHNVGVEFGEPSWGYGSAMPPPWKNAGPYTREETEKVFQEGLNYFPPAPPVDEIKYSRDLVPVKFEGSAPAASKQQYQGGVPYALYSVKAEPLEMEIGTGATGNRDAPPSRYTIKDSGDKKIAEGVLPVDGKAHHLQIKVPKAGLYFLEFNDFGAGWTLSVAAGHPVSLLLSRGRSYRHAGWMQPMYFYVPKGTKEIQYYWGEGYLHDVHRPDGKLVRTVNETGRYITVPVPAGMDGKPWHFEKLVPGHLWFFNVPNVLAASPNALLLPRELVAKDGLNILK